MKRSDLEHLIRAASAITGERELIVIGSQAILGEYPDAPAELLVSVEADLVPLRDARNADLIDGSIGEESPFHRTFGYYAQGVHLEVAMLAEGWRVRLVTLSNENTGGAAGLCLQASDIASSKLFAGREKDLEFVSALLRHGLATANVISERIESTPTEAKLRERALNRLVRAGREQS